MPSLTLPIVFAVSTEHNYHQLKEGTSWAMFSCSGSSVKFTIAGESSILLTIWIDREVQTCQVTKPNAEHSRALVFNVVACRPMDKASCKFLGRHNNAIVSTHPVGIYFDTEHKSWSAELYDELLSLLSSTLGGERMSYFQNDIESTCRLMSLNEVPEPVPIDASRPVAKYSHRGTVPWRSFQRLETQWLDDEVINFGTHDALREASKSQPTLSAVTHIFITFFMEKLRKNGVQSVRKWAKAVDIFALKYLVFPVPTGSHWYLIIIINPGGCLSEKLLDGLHTITCVLDSLPPSDHAKDVSRLHEWLAFVAKHTRRVRKLAPIKTITPRVPTQPNFDDCGIYLLHFLRIFLHNPERMMEKIMTHSRDSANEDWEHTRIATLRGELHQALCKQAVRNWVDGRTLDTVDDDDPAAADVKLVGGVHEPQMILSDSDSELDL